MLPHNAGDADAGEPHSVGDNELGRVSQAGPSLAPQCTLEDNQRHSTHIELGEVHPHASQNFIGRRIETTLDRRGNDYKPAGDLL